jgi:nucleoside-diphosphate-sugar epimerase
MVIASSRPKIAILGANGFVGSRAVEMFHLTGFYEVIPIVRQVISLARLSRFDLPWRLADATQAEDLVAALAGCEAVVDCTVGLPKSIETSAKTLIPAAHMAGVKRVVYLSSASVHGQNPFPGTDEHSTLSERQEMAYNIAKVRAERRLLKDSERLGVELFMLRPSIVFGPRDRWINNLVNELEQGVAWLINDGGGICNTIYVDNLVEAIRCCLIAPRSAAGQPYLVGDHETVTWRDLYHATANRCGVDKGQIHPIDIPALPVRTWFDRLNLIRVMPASQKMIAALPSRLKRVIKGAVEGWQPPGIPNPWQLPDKASLILPSREMVLLQQCRHRFPQDRAFKQLGYQAVVSFEEGLDRTLAWIKWARY